MARKLTGLDPKPRSAMPFSSSRTANLSSRGWALPFDCGRRSATQPRLIPIPAPASPKRRRREQAWRCPTARAAPCSGRREGFGWGTDVITGVHGLPVAAEAILNIDLVPSRNANRPAPLRQYTGPCLLTGSSTPRGRPGPDAIPCGSLIESPPPGCYPLTRPQRPGQRRRVIWRTMSCLILILRPACRSARGPRA